MGLLFCCDGASSSRSSAAGCVADRGTGVAGRAGATRRRVAFAANAAEQLRYRDLLGRTGEAGRNRNVRESISEALHDLKVLQRLALVPGAIGRTIGLLVLVFTFLWWSDDRPRMVWWFGPAQLTGVPVSAALLWFASQMRRGSLLTTQYGAWTLSVGGLLLAGWWSLAGESLDTVVLIAFVPTILAGSNWWALSIAHRLYSRFPECLSRPHATRRLSLPRDARALRAVVPGLLGGLYVLGGLCTALVLAPLLQQRGSGRGCVDVRANGPCSISTRPRDTRFAGARGSSPGPARTRARFTIIRRR